MTINLCKTISSSGCTTVQPVFTVQLDENIDSRARMRTLSSSAKRTTCKGVTKQSLAAFIASLSILMCGNAMGWITPILLRLIGPTSDVPMSADQISWVISFIELGNLFTPLPAGILVDYLGRKPLLLFSAPIYTIGWVLVLSTRSVYMLYIVRIIQGLGMGIVFTVLPMYLGEIAEPKIRGFISTFFQGMWYTGVLIPYCVGPYVSYQCLNYVMSVTPIIFLLTFIWIPESPYFLLMKKRKRQALEALSWLRGLKLAEALEELEEIEASVDEEMRNNLCSLTEIFSIKVYRRALLIVIIVSSSEIGSGITAVLSYASETFSKTEESFLTPDQFTIIMGVFIVIATFVAAAMVDSMGRRPLLLISSIGCSIFDLIAGIFFFVDKKTTYDISQYSWVGFASITSYCVLLSVGLGPLTTTVQSEFFPANTRGMASGITAVTITVLSFAFLKLYEVISYNVGLFLNYLLYSFSCFVASVLIYLVVPETKGKSLAEIQIELQKNSPSDDIAMNKR